jgi:hypothetical protein
VGPPGCPVHTGHVLFAVRCASMGTPAFCACRARINCVAGSHWRRIAVDPELHRTLSGGTPDSPVRQTRGAFGWPFAPLLNSKLDLFIG